MSASTAPSAASQGRDSCAIDDLRLAAACTSPRPSLYCTVSSCGRVKTFADEAWREACHWHPFAAIPASLVGDHEPKLGRRASATGSGCPGAVCFQVVGVVLLPCIDDVHDREIEHHRRESLTARYRVRGKRVFRAISSQTVHLAREASSSPPDAAHHSTCPSAFAHIHIPAAKLAPHCLLTFPPAVPRGPDKTPLSIHVSNTAYTPHGRQTGLVSSRAAKGWPDSRHTPLPQGQKERTPYPVTVQCHSSSVAFLRSFLRQGRRSQTKPTGTEAKINHLLRQVCVWSFRLPQCSLAQPHAGPRGDTRQGCKFISKAPPAEPLLDRSICFNRTLPRKSLR